MKNIVFLSTFLFFFSIGCHAQSEIAIKSDSKITAFRDQYGSLMKEETYNLGEINRIKYDVIVYTDLIKNEKVAGLQVTTSDSRYSYFGYLDSDEIDAAVQTLNYIRDNILGTTPSVPTKIEYNTRDKVRIGISAEANGNWVAYVFAHSYDKNTKTTFVSYDIPKMIEVMTRAQSIISDKIH